MCTMSKHVLNASRCTWVYTFIHEYVNIYMHIHYILTYVMMHVYTMRYIYAHIHAHTYVHTHTCTHMHAHTYMHHVHTEWQRPIECLIFISYFLQNSPVISGSFAKRNLQLKVSYASLPLCTLPLDLFTPRKTSKPSKNKWFIYVHTTLSHAEHAASLCLWDIAHSYISMWDIALYIPYMKQRVPRGTRCFSIFVAYGSLIHLYVGYGSLLNQFHIWSSVVPVSFIFGIWLTHTRIHMWDMAHSYVWHDTYECVMSYIQMRHL